jgi:hypothetical protein
LFIPCSNKTFNATIDKKALWSIRTAIALAIGVIYPDEITLNFFIIRGNCSKDVTIDYNITTNIDRNGYSDVEEGYDIITDKLRYAVMNGTLEQEIQNQADENGAEIIKEAKVNSTALVVDGYEVPDTSPTSAPTTIPSSTPTTHPTGDDYNSRNEFVAGVVICGTLFFVFYSVSVVTGFLRVGRVYFSSVLSSSSSNKTGNATRRKNITNIRSLPSSNSVDDFGVELGDVQQIGDDLEELKI